MTSLLKPALLCLVLLAPLAARAAEPDVITIDKRNPARLQWRLDPASEPLRETDRKPPLPRAREPVGADERPHRRKFGVGAAEARIKRARQQDAARNVDAAPIAMEPDLGPALGAEIGVRRPGNVAEQARGKADAAVLRRLPGEQRRDPVGDRAAVLGSYGVGIYAEGSVHDVAAPVDDWGASAGVFVHAPLAI